MESIQSPPESVDVKQKVVDGKTKKEHLKSSEKEPHVHFEFGGSVGAIGIIFGLPVVILLLFILCNDEYCLKNPFELNFAKIPLSFTTRTVGVNHALVMYVVWLAFHVLLERTLPGETASGVVLPDGNRLQYTLSGHVQFWITILSVLKIFPVIEFSENSIVIQRFFALLPVDNIFDHYFALCLVSIAGSFFLSIYL